MFLDKKWIELIKEAKKAKKALKIHVREFSGKKREAFFGFDPTTNAKSLIIQLSEELISIPKLPAVNGIEYNKKKVEGIFCLIISTNDKYFDLAQDCLNKLSEAIKPSHDDKKALKAVTDFLVRNKHYFSSKSLNIDLLTGLFGELYFINNFLIKEGKMDNIEYWLGPDKNKFDFEIPDKFIEIKMKTENKTNIIISNESQLDPSRGEGMKLYLVVFSYNRVKSEKNSLNDIILDIRNKIKKKPLLTKHFNDGIAAIGITEKNIKEFSYYFDITNVNLYEVKNDFPRIIKSNIPFDDIFDVSYSLSLQGLSKYSVSKSNLLK